MRIRRFHQLREVDVARRERRDASSAKRGIVFVLLGCAALLGWFDLVIASDWLCVREVRADGLKQLEQEEVTREVFQILDERGSWRPWSSRHAWFVDRDLLARKLQERLFAEKVTVDKFDGDVLRLKIEERSKRIILHSHQQYVWVDLNGIVTADLNNDEKRDAQSRLLGQRAPHFGDAPIVNMNIDRDLQIRENAAHGDDVKSWIQSAALIMKEGFFYREMLLPQDASSTTATLIAPEGYKVYADLGESLAPQIRSYLAFLKPPRTDLKVLEYVDIRIPGKVYVK